MLIFGVSLLKKRDRKVIFGAAFGGDVPHILMLTPLTILVLEATRARRGWGNKCGGQWTGVLGTCSLPGPVKAPGLGFL